VKSFTVSDRIAWTTDASVIGLGKTVDPAATAPNGFLKQVGHNYFETFDLPVLDGRTFDRQRETRPYRLIGDPGPDPMPMVIDRTYAAAMGYPTPEEERQIIQSRAAADPVEGLQAVVSTEDVNRLCERVNEVKLDDAVTSYVVEIANRTRSDRTLVAGVSPRGAIHLTRAARAHALVEGRDYATPDDIKAVAVNVLSHRVVEKRSRASQDGRAASAQILRKILQEIPVPH
jgi:hypothetical protein